MSRVNRPRLCPLSSRLPSMLHLDLTFSYFASASSHTYVACLGLLGVLANCYWSGMKTALTAGKEDC